MPEKISQYVLSGGRFYLEDITRSEIKLTEIGKREIASAIAIKMPNLFTVGKGNTHVGVTFSGVDQLVSIKLPALKLRTSYNLNPEGFLVPSFDPGNREQIDFTPGWQVPENMDLMFYSSICIQNNNQYQLSSTYIVALYKEENPPKSYLLPLPNIHDDGRLCAGPPPPSQEATLARAFEAEIVRFMDATWNSDLLSTWRVDNSQKLFRWSVDQGTFVQALPSGDWRSLCRVISPPFITEICR